MTPQGRKSANAVLPRGCRVLLADDTSAGRRLLSIVLGKAGAEVVAVENGRAAIDKSLEAMRAGQSFDAIVLDMSMPIVDGYEAARGLRGDGYRGPIVALTAHVLPGEREKCLAAGCDDYVGKPVECGPFLAMLSRRVAEARSQSGAPTAPSAVPAAPARPPKPAKTLLESLPERERASLLADFVAGLVERTDQMEAALAAGDADELLSLAHAIHGTAYLFSFPEIAQTAGQIERGLREGTPAEQFAPVVARLSQLCRAAGEPKA